MHTIGVSLFVVFSLAAGGEQKKDKEPTPNKPRFTIGKETTYVTRPLHPDGYIDYVTALNERIRQGVTPANNANVLIWQALGPHPLGDKSMPAEYFQWLGIPEPPAKGDYFIDLARFAKGILRLDAGAVAQVNADLDRCIQGPWAAKDYPHVAAWLKVNEKPLAVLIEATHRSQFFSPIVPPRAANGSYALINALLPAVAACRDVGKALTARAMFRIGAGAQDAAWSDLLACHRLGHLVGRGACLIECLVGIWLDNLAGRGDVRFLHYARPDAKQIEKCLRDLDQLPAMAEVAAKVDLEERFSLLNIMLMVNRHGARFLENLSDEEKPKETPWMHAVMRPIGELMLLAINWDPALFNANRWCDRVVAALREETPSARQAKFDELCEELRVLRRDAFVNFGDRFQDVLIDPNLSFATKVNRSRDLYAEIAGNIIISTMFPAVDKVQRAADRNAQTRANVLVAFALAWYQREHACYPATLKALAPMYLRTVAIDSFSGDSLIYRPGKDGYLLYSVGNNGEDEQGRSYGDEPKGDDLPIRMPLPAHSAN